MPSEHAPASPAADGAPADGAPATVDPSPTPAARRYVPLLDVIRIVAIIGVVTVHVIADHVGPDSPLAVLLLRALLAVAVPAFVMISGVLNLDPAAMRDGTGSYLGRRLRRLLPAAVVWTALYVLLSVGLGAEPLLSEETVRGLLEASTFPHLYFLPLIIGLTVITPPLVGYLAEAPRRAWGAGAVAAVWAAAAIGLGPLTAGLFEEPITPLRLGALTFFLPYVGYYLLGRAAWTAAPTRRPVLAALAALGTVMTAATVLAYRADWTQEPPGAVLLPTYSSPTVMAMSVAWMALLLACGRSWQVGRRAQSWLRELGNASFGVFLLHFAVLLALRALGFPQATAVDLLLLTAVVTAVSFALVVAGRRVPLLREIL